MSLTRFVRFMKEAAATNSRIEKAEAFMKMGAAPSTAHELIFKAMTPFTTFGVKGRWSTPPRTVTPSTCSSRCWTSCPTAH
ncbi:hypothetical protein Phage2-1_00052 [Achromobacter phage 2-1]|nr:hypothetical protein Phage2-1_00052 [Achromobacter phage 2-1]